MKISRDHPLSTSAKFPEKTNVCNPLIRALTYAYQGVTMLVFREILRTYLVDSAQGLNIHSTGTGVYDSSREVCPDTNQENNFVGIC